MTGAPFVGANSRFSSPGGSYKPGWNSFGIGISKLRCQDKHENKFLAESPFAFICAVVRIFSSRLCDGFVWSCYVVSDVSEHCVRLILK